MNVYLNKLKKNNIAVYINFVNGEGDLIDQMEIARFSNKSWAESFIADIQAKAAEEKAKAGYTGYEYEIKEIE